MDGFDGLVKNMLD